MSRHGEYAPHHDEPRSGHAELSDNDKRLLDALVENEFDVDAIEPLTDAERDRISVLVGMFGLLNDYPVDDSDETLVHATLARIHRYEDQQAERMSFDRERRGEGARGSRIPNLIGVAAAILLLAGLTMPILNSVQQQSINAACNNNLRLMGYAFGNYAADNNGQLPVVAAGFGRKSWDRFSNHVNLGPLIEGQYCERGHLNCPGHQGPADGVYSYQWQKEGARLTWGAGRVTIILGDRNPLMDAARKGVMLPPDTLSPDHRGRGQNVLATDGATLWLDRTVVDRNDNIWLPHGTNQLQYGVRPTDQYDVFLSH